MALAQLIHGLQVIDPLVVDLLEPEVPREVEEGHPELFLASLGELLDLLPGLVRDRGGVGVHLRERDRDVELLLERVPQGREIPVVGVLVRRAEVEHRLLDQIVGQIVDALALLDERDHGLVRRLLDDRLLVGVVLLGDVR